VSTSPSLRAEGEAIQGPAYADPWIASPSARNDGRRERRWFAVVGVLVFVLGLALPGAWSAYVDSLGPLDLSPASLVSTIVVDRDGRLLRAFTLPDGRWRLPARVADVDPRYIAMLVAYEDKRFYEHGGVDWRAMVRASLQLIRRGRVVSGGSTLTMQVARLIEPRDNRTLAAKLRQIARAGEIEAVLSKRGVLDRYLAMAPYGGNIEGVRAATLSWFGKEPKRLSVGEAALLVALPQSPEARRPDRFPDAARRARAMVLDRALSAGVITAEQAAAAKAEPLPTERRPFPMLGAHAAQEAIDADPSAHVLRLSIDARLQSSLEALALQSAARLGPKLSAAMLVIDNATGEIRAHVGGANFLDDARAGAVDLTRSPRSPGSALKPLIYAMAFEEGLAHPETMLFDRPARYGAWAPENFDLGFQGAVTARRALQMSLNLPAIELLADIGAPSFLARLHGAGAKITLPKDAPPGLAIGLGGLGISLTDLARLYVGLARGGEAPPLIERLDGPAHEAQAPRRITDPVAAWYVGDILRGAPPPTNALGGRIAFKTGTSYGFRDALAIGYDRRTTIAVWVGRPDNAPTPGLIGRAVAAPILFDAFARLGRAIEPVEPPRGVLRVASAADLPPPLQRLRRDAPKAGRDATQELRIAFPPDGARVDLALAQGASARLSLKALGGTPPLLWFVNGAPIGAPQARRQSEWKPDGAGFAKVSVVDAKGATDSIVVRLE
jgi:penicillin-binding protein 1C